VIKVFESVGQTADLFDIRVDGFRADVIDAVGVELGENFGSPGAEGPAEPGNFGDRAAVEVVQYLDRDLAAFRWNGVVDGAELSVALPGHVHLVCGVAGVEACADLGLLLLGEVLYAMTEQPADLVERIVFVAAPA
jgi:hypothetical protein